MSSPIALLIDAENVSYKNVSEILQAISRQGEIVLCAVYGDWDQPTLQSWYQVAEEHHFKIRHQTSHPSTKNSSDMKLIMDAMEVLHRIPIDALCLVTNDADYVPLCDKAHEYGKYVIGMGYQHASEAFIRACDQFIFMRSEEEPSEPLVDIVIPVIEPIIPQETVESSPKQYNQKQLKKQLTKGFEQASPDDDGWVTLSALGTIFSQSGFEYNQFGHANLTKLLESQSSIIEIRVKGTVASARLRNQQLNKKQLESLVKKAFAKTSPDVGGWVTLSSLGSALRGVKSDFKPNHYGHSTLTKFLQSMSHLVQLKSEGSVKSARLKK